MATKTPLVIISIILLSTAGLAQEHETEVFGGFSYLNADNNGGIGPRRDANGWEAAVSTDLTKRLAVEGDFGAHYVAASSSDSVPLSAAHIYTVMGGPRFNFKPLFVHALFGMAHVAVSPSGAAVVSQDGFGTALGLGSELKISHHLAIRVSADYLLAYTGQPDRKAQNCARASVGFVYRFGGSRTDSGVKHASDTPTSVAAPPKVERRAAPANPSAGMNVSALGVVASLGRSQGAEIIEEVPNGVAAQAGLHPGDVINVVDGKPVKTPMELAAELSNRPVGDKARLGYLLHGAWQTETVVFLAH